MVNPTERKKSIKHLQVGMVMRQIRSGSGQTRTRTLLFFIDSDPDSDPKGPKFSDLDPDPPDLTSLGFLMGLKQSLFDLSKLNLLRFFLYFCKQFIIVLETLVRVHEIQIHLSKCVNCVNGVNVEI